MRKSKIATGASCLQIFAGAGCGVLSGLVCASIDIGRVFCCEKVTMIVGGDAAQLCRACS